LKQLLLKRRVDCNPPLEDLNEAFLYLVGQVDRASEGSLVPSDDRQHELDLKEERLERTLRIEGDILWSESTSTAAILGENEWSLPTLSDHLFELLLDKLDR
jgi:hypothetical protein